MPMGMPIKNMRRVRRAPWDKIRTEYESGDVTVDELALKWSIKAGTLRSKASREKWNTPNRLKKAIDSVAEMFQESREMKTAMAALVKGTSLENQYHQAGPQMQHRAAADLGPADYQAFVAELAMRSVRNGLAKVRTPNSWGDIAKADTLARRALGLDAKGGGGSTTMIRISGPTGTVDVATSSPVDVGGDYEATDEDDWDD